MRFVSPRVFAVGICQALLCLFTLPAAAQVRYTAAQLREDLVTLESSIRSTHPDLQHSTEEPAFAQALRSVRERLDRPMTRDEAWQTFATLNPVLADGHLFVNFANWRGDTDAYLKAGGVLFPFEVHVTPDGQAVIRSELGGGESPLAGARVRSINGLDARDVAKALAARVHGDTPAFRADLLSRRWWLYYWRMYGAPAEFAIVLDDAARTTVRMPGSERKPVTLAIESTFETQFAFQLLPCDAALLTVRSFSWDKQPFLDFTHEAFRKMREAGVRRLVIDVRDNGGGDDDMWIEGLLPYFATKPYRWASNYKKRVLEGHRDEGEQIGSVVSGSIDRWIPPQPDNPLRYSGEVYVLVGGGTYSSAVLFTNVVRDFGFGKIAGTGGSARADQSGGIQKTVLPNTGLAVWSPRFVLQRPSGASQPILVEPDIAIEEDPLRPAAAVDRLLTRVCPRQTADVIWSHERARSTPHPGPRTPCVPDRSGMVAATG